MCLIDFGIERSKVKVMVLVVENGSRPMNYGDIFLPLHASYFSTDYVNMQDTYVNMQDNNYITHDIFHLWSWNF